MLRDELIPLARVITPNAIEAGALLGRPAPTTVDEMHEAARDLVALGPAWALVTGGHVDTGDECVDVLAASNGDTTEISVPRSRGPGTAWDGCTLSSAIASLLAQGNDVLAACERAQDYVGLALDASNDFIGARSRGRLSTFSIRHSARDHPYESMNLGRLYLVATPRRHMPEPEFLARIRAALDGGVGILQLRCKDTEALAYLKLAERVARLARDAGVPFIVNDRPDIALASGADGVHLGQGDLPVEWARRMVPDLMIGRSSHEAAHATQGDRRARELLRRRSGMGDADQARTLRRGTVVCERSRDARAGHSVVRDRRHHARQRASGARRRRDAHRARPRLLDAADPAEAARRFVDAIEMSGRSVAALLRT